MPLTIGGHNYNAGLRYLDEDFRRQELAARLRQQALSAQESQQRLALAQREQRFQESRAAEQASIESARIAAQYRNQALQQAEDKRRFDVSREDTLENRGYQRGREAEETGYRRSLDADNRLLALENRDYGRGRDAVQDQRWEQQQAALNTDREERRRLTEDENKRRDTREAEERKLQAEKQEAWREDRKQMSADRRAAKSVAAIDLQIRAKERDYQTAIQLGEADAVARLDAEIGILEQQKARALDADGREGVLMSREETEAAAAGRPRSVREDLAAAVADKTKERKKEKDLAEEDKRRDLFARDVMQQAGQSSAQEYMSFVQNEAVKRGLKPDDPAIARAMSANPTVREIQRAESELKGLGPAEVIGEVSESLQALQDPKQRQELARAGINVRELHGHLQRKLNAAQRAMESGRAKAEQRVKPVQQQTWTDALQGAVLPGLTDAVTNWRNWALLAANPATAGYGGLKFASDTLR